MFLGVLGVLVFKKRMGWQKKVLEFFLRDFFFLGVCFDFFFSLLAR